MTIFRTAKTQAWWNSVSDPRSASKHVLFALGVDPTARDPGEGGGFDLVSQATPFTVSCDTIVAVHVSSPHKSSQASQNIKQML